MTAVEWLVNEVNSDCLNSAFIRHELIEKAKAMEKEQIKDAYSQGALDSKYMPYKYYNETYGQD